MRKPTDPQSEAYKMKRDLGRKICTKVPDLSLLNLFVALKVSTSVRPGNVIASSLNQEVFLLRQVVLIYLTLLLRSPWVALYVLWFD